MQKANLLNINDTELLNILKDADFYKANGQIERPKKGAYSYMDGKNIVISLEVIHAIGDHAEFKISH